MRRDLLTLLRCPECATHPLDPVVFHEGPQGVESGVLTCRACGAWYPIEGGQLELLPQSLQYAEDRAAFRSSHEARMRAAGIAAAAPEPGTADPRAVQQRHFDWYAENRQQTYDAYERMPFWRAVDARIMARWRPLIPAGARVLDVGCAQGRASAWFRDLPVRLVGFDVSKRLAAHAAARARREQWRADATFFAGDASRFPFVDGSFDVVLVYGVLHHLPDPGAACAEIARVLRPGGRFLGSENNRTGLREIFEWVQRRRPLWHEEAGAQPLISEADLRAWLRPHGMQISCHTSVFVPPHAVNLLPERAARWVVNATDAIGAAVPGLRRHGGLITVTGTREPRYGEMR